MPDPSVPEQRVSFGTSGHRGSAFKANEFLDHDLSGLKRISFEKALRSSTTHRHDNLNLEFGESAYGRCWGSGHSGAEAILGETLTAECLDANP
jgi:hypothetical protein